MRDEIGTRVSELSTNYTNPFTKIFLEIKKRIAQNWSEKTIHATIFILMTCLALLARILIAYYYRVNFGSNTIYFWDNQVDFNPNSIPFEGYKDFHWYYVNWARAWYQDGWNPYPIWWKTNILDPLDMYSYPPLFLYILVVFWKPGVTKFWLGFPLMLTDALCAGMVYLILKTILKKEIGYFIAFIGGLLMVFSPINMIYAGVYWLNIGPVTLFSLVCFYFLIQRKWWQTFFWLAIATMCKQDGLFFIYPIFMVMLAEKIREKEIKKGVKESIGNVGVFLFTCIICSIPWIFVTPINYGVHLLFPGKMLSLDSDIGEISQVHSFSWALYYNNIRGILLSIVSFGINSMLFMIVSATAITIFLMWRVFHQKMDDIEFFEYMAIYVIITHIFMPRGVFKFYTPFYVPFIIIAIVASLSQFNKKKIFWLITLPIMISLIIGFGIWHQYIIGYSTPILLFFMSIFLLLLNIVRLTFNKYWNRYQLKRSLQQITPFN